MWFPFTFSTIPFPCVESSSVARTWNRTDTCLGDINRTICNLGCSVCEGRSNDVSTAHTSYALSHYAFRVCDDGIKCRVNEECWWIFDDETGDYSADNNAIRWGLFVDNNSSMEMLKQALSNNLVQCCNGFYGWANLRLDDNLIN